MQWVIYSSDISDAEDIFTHLSVVARTSSCQSDFASVTSLTGFSFDSFLKWSWIEWMLFTKQAIRSTNNVKVHLALQNMLSETLSRGNWKQTIRKGYSQKWRPSFNNLFRTCLIKIPRLQSYSFQRVVSAIIPSATRLYHRLFLVDKF